MLFSSIRNVITILPILFLYIIEHEKNKKKKQTQHHMNKTDEGKKEKQEGANHEDGREKKIATNTENYVQRV